MASRIVRALPLLLFLHSSTAFRLQSMRPHCSPRASTPRCLASEPPPRDLDTVCEEARACLREALLQGKRGLTVEASMASLDVTSRAYDAPVLARKSNAAAH